jgi:hypothetical protein
LANRFVADYLISQKLPDIERANYGLEGHLARPSGREKKNHDTLLQSALIQADHDRSRGLEVLRIEGPEGEFISAGVEGTFSDAA